MYSYIPNSDWNKRKGVYRLQKKVWVTVIEMGKVKEGQTSSQGRYISMEWHLDQLQWKHKSSPGGGVSSGEMQTRLRDQHMQGLGSMKKQASWGAAWFNMKEAWSTKEGSMGLGKEKWWNVKMETLSRH